MKIKKLAAFIFSIFVMLCFTGCLNLLNYTKSKSKSSYTFNITNMPSDSVGMTVRARTSNGYDYVEEEIGVVTDINTTLKKTVSLYSFADKLEINFYKGDSIKYYVPVSNKHKNSQTGEYDISGYYYYYAAASGQLNAVIDVSKIQTLEYDKKYRFSTNDVPYLIWKATGVKDKNIRCTIDSKDNIAMYFFTNLQEFVEGSKERYKSNIFKCPADEVYILICPYEPRSEASMVISFSLTEVDADALMEIDTAVFASNGKLYAFGTNSLSNPRCNLWRVEADSEAMYKVKAFGDNISAIAELVPGTLFVSHGKTISKVNLETNETTDLAVLDYQILAIENYKNDYVLAVCDSDDYKNQVRLVEKATGTVKKIAAGKLHNYLKNINNFLYIPEIDIYVFDTKGLSPNDINYLIIDDTDPENLSYISKDSQYHLSSHIIDGPYTVLDTDSSQGKARVIACGEVYEIDRSAALENNTTWCEAASGVSCIMHKACYILDDAIYYASEDGFDLTVKKCSKTSTSDYRGSKKFNREKAVKFFYKNTSVYLLTNSTVQSDGENNYRIYLHKIDF